MSFDPLQILSDRFRAAIRAALPDLPGDADPLISPSKNPQHGDYQCNAAMPLAKSAGKPPREIAQAIVGKVDVSDIAEPLTAASIAGPGFINIKLRADALATLLAKTDEPSLGIDRVVAGADGGGAKPPTVVVDLCGVNLAKQMHVGHLRSIIIGDALARLFERTGWRVVRQNHVGDWGLPIAMVVTKLADEAAAGRIDPGTLRLDELERLYKLAQKECDADERGLNAARKWWSHPKAVAELEAQVSGANEALARAKATLLRLQTHDAAAMATWQRIVDITMAECLATCRRLAANITAEHSAGESAYAEELAPMVEDLLKRGVAEMDQGAVVIRVEGIEEPCLIRRSEAGGGGFLYATTDMAAVRRRVQTFGASRVIYVVDARQSLHFRLVFGACRKAGFDVVPGNGPASLEHAANGTILGEDNKPLKTRSGENVKLSDLIDEAIERAAAAVGTKQAELAESERAKIAQTVGVAAIKYAELSANRSSDYVFSFDRMLAFEGNTGPYLLYALARIRNIFKKAGAAGGTGAAGGAGFALSTKEEKDLALALLKYPSALASVAAALEPHRLCQYLYELCTSFSAFYTVCRVIDAETEALRASRLRLCALTERVLADGLGVLGIPTLERM